MIKTVRIVAIRTTDHSVELFGASNSGQEGFGQGGCGHLSCRLRKRRAAGRAAPRSSWPCRPSPRPTAPASPTTCGARANPSPSSCAPPPVSGRPRRAHRAPPPGPAGPAGHRRLGGTGRPGDVRVRPHERERGGLARAPRSRPLRPARPLRRRGPGHALRGPPPPPDQAPAADHPEPRRVPALLPRPLGRHRAGPRGRGAGADQRGGRRPVPRRGRLRPGRDPRRVAACFPHAEVVVQPGVAHCPWLDDPEEFRRRIAGFLDR